MKADSCISCVFLYSCLVLSIIRIYCTKIILYEKGHAAAQLVEALRYKPEGRGFDSRWCHWDFSLT